MTAIALYEAKNRLTEIVREVETGPSVELTRHGKAVAVLLGAQTYQELTQERQGFHAAYTRFRAEWSLTEEDTVDSGLSALRSTDPGRDFEF